tara:strand:+ start:99 stop:356 length:258 start_codon:yes stop_codon:yes gene_type:complete
MENLNPIIEKEAFLQRKQIRTLKSMMIKSNLLLKWDTEIVRLYDTNGNYEIVLLQNATKKELISSLLRAYYGTRRLKKAFPEYIK